MPDSLVSGLSTYYRLLLRWNEKVNLTSTVDLDGSLDRMLVEPIAAGRYLPAHTRSLLDIGSGGGSPAIPLKLLDRSLRVVLVEPKTRKSAFLREAVRTLELEDVCVETCRYEELLSRIDLHEAMDLVTIRAVRMERAVFSAVQSFLRRDGRLMLFGGVGSGAGRFAPELLPSLEVEGSHLLGEPLRGRIVVIRKRSVGREA